MSAYGYQMEQGDSNPSLSSQGGSRPSDLGSRYVVESGIYMTSFAATIFIASFITTGVLLITMLITLAVMLRSCENKNAGIIEIRKLNDDYDYCKTYFLHAELNGLKIDEFPSICKVRAIQYLTEAQYMRDLNTTIQLAEDYFSSVTPLDDGLDVVLVDIDDIVHWDPHYIYSLKYRLDQYGCNDCIEQAKHSKHRLILRLYLKLQARGWRIILLSRKDEKQRNGTIENLTASGYMDWYSLIMRLDDEIEGNSSEYFSKRRTIMMNEGLRITGIISSRIDALTGPCLGKQIFKLPKPIYYYFEHHIETTNFLL